MMKDYYDCIRWCGNIKHVSKSTNMSGITNNNNNKKKDKRNEHTLALLVLIGLKLFQACKSIGFYFISPPSKQNYLYKSNKKKKSIKLTNLEY